MRMSLSRFAALGVALLAGVTLASCASSASIVAASGPIAQPFGTNNARVRFVQGSPNLNLGITTVDLYIDGRFAGTFPYGVVSPVLYSLPAGTHTFALFQAGTLNTVFAATSFALTAGTKYAVVAAGDAANHSTKLMLFIEPKYATPSGNWAVSVFNASPRAGTVDFLVRGFNILIDTPVGTGIIVGSPMAPVASWKLNVLPPPSPLVCISAYPTATTTPLISGWPLPISDEHTGINCNLGVPGSTATLPGTNFFNPPFGPTFTTDLNLYLVDFLPAPATTSIILAAPD